MKNPRPLKVYRVNIDGLRDRMVAATSWEEAAEKMDLRLSGCKRFGSVTGNEYDRKVAMMQPGVPFEARITTGKPDWEALFIGPSGDA